MSSPTTERISPTTEVTEEIETVESPSVELYERTVLGAAIKAANLLDELISLSIIPDARVKDAADLAIQLVALMNEKIAKESTELSTGDFSINGLETEEAIAKTKKAKTKR
ncbi:MAG: hypothetical protein AAFN12_16990 [Cyanobacteria bacterium J06560_2]